ncbi:MAG: RES domain-containing protein [Verrucomicrobiia bacterium]
MSSEASTGRKLLSPPADFDQLAIPSSRQRVRQWFRIHRAGQEPLRFARLAHHRFSHPDCPYPLLYLGATIQTCLWEVFGDDMFQNKRIISLDKWQGRRISQVTVPELRVCACNQLSTRSVMRVDKASLLASSLAVPQAWGLAVQPALRSKPLFASRNPGVRCSDLVRRSRGHLPKT